MKQSEIWSRVERLMLARGWTWHQASAALELSTGMLSMVKTGKRGISKRALHRLSEAERAAGIPTPGGEGPPDPQRLEVREARPSYETSDAKSSRTAVLQTLDGLETALARMTDQIAEIRKKVQEMSDDQQSGGR